MSLPHFARRAAITSGFLQRQHTFRSRNSQGSRNKRSYAVSTALRRSVSEAVNHLTETFERSGVPEANNSACHLIAKTLGSRNIDSLELRGLEELTASQEEELSRYQSCRLARMPVQYIVGDWDFRRITINTRPPVFIPRPETEELVGHVLDHFKSTVPVPDRSHLNVLEVGCGSGAICLSLLKETSQPIRVLALDQSEHACALTEENYNLNFSTPDDASADERKALTIVQTKVEGDEDSDWGLKRMLGPDTIDVIVSNPPYILRKDVAALPEEIKVFEDLRALDGGKHGLDVIEPLLGLARKYLIRGGRIFLEVDPCHAFLVPQLIQDKAAYGLEGLKIQHILKDFRGNDRFIVITKVLS